jgi:putative nucleotidyltransferase with HDIG domain
VNRDFSILAGAGAAAAALIMRERKRRRQAERFAAAALESLLRAIDANDPETGAHVRRVAEYSLIIADALGVSAPEQRIIEFTALFHDIGKIHEALFDIVHGPRRLTVAERRAIATHPERGAEVLAPIATFHPDLAEAVLAHHEMWNGAGYPRGLKGRRIPLAARVVMIADTFDAITRRRRYRGGRSTKIAAATLLEGRGTQFDPDLVDLILLPPVFDRITRAHRIAARRGDALPRHRKSGGTERAPKIDIRWRSRSEAPTGVRDKMTLAR